MKKRILFNSIEVAVTWNDRLKPGTEVYVHTGDPGLAINIMELFLDEMGKRHHWYESSWLSYDDYQEMNLTECSEDNWKGWSRQLVLSKGKIAKNK